jgi:hypothetical protein
VLFTMPTMARLMLTLKMNVTVMPRKNIRQSRYLAAMRSVDKTVRFNVWWSVRTVTELQVKKMVGSEGSQSRKRVKYGYEPVGVGTKNNSAGETSCDLARKDL